MPLGLVPCGFGTRGCHLSQPRLLSMLDTCTARLAAHPARRALCTFGDAGALRCHPRACIATKAVFKSRDELCHAPWVCTSRSKSHAHPSPVASTAPCPSTPRARCQPPQSCLSTFPTMGVPVPPSTPASRRGAGSLGITA